MKLLARNMREFSELSFDGGIVQVGECPFEVETIKQTTCFEFRAVFFAAVIFFDEK